MLQDLELLASLPMHVILVMALYLQWKELRRVSEHMEALLDKLVDRVIEEPDK